MFTIMHSTLRSPGARLALFAVVVGAALGAGALAGATVGPEPPPSTEDSAPAHGGDHDTSSAPDTSTSPETGGTPPGLAVSQDGYTLELRTPTVNPDEPAALEFVITGRDGEPVIDYDLEQTKELHFIVLARDLSRYAHLHPTRDEEGVWRVTAPALSPGSYRLYADFIPDGGEGLTLATDLAVPGDYQPVAMPEPSTIATVDDYEVTFDGELVAGTSSELSVTVAVNGEPVTDLQPYLGALGHLVAIRAGDLAYLHVHPLDEADAAGGPTVRFAVEVPTAGTYGLFLDFSHDDTVRTATVTANASSGVGDDTHEG
jgi:hypothetical protein